MWRANECHKGYAVAVVVTAAPVCVLVFFFFGRVWPPLTFGRQVALRAVSDDSYQFGQLVIFHY